MISVSKTRIHTIGDVVTYKNKPYVIVHEDFDCGGNFHILGIVRINKCYPIFLKVKYIEEGWLNN